MIRRIVTERGRWAETSRVAATTVGAFVTGGLASTALSLILVLCGTDRADAVTIAIMASPVILALVSLAAFHARGPFRIWLWLGVGASSLIAVIAQLRETGA